MYAASVVRRLALGAAVAAALSMGLLTACGAKEEPADSPMPSSSQVAPNPPSTTEKGVPHALTPGPNAGSGPKKSMPGKPGPAPVVVPGDAATGG